MIRCRFALGMYVAMGFVMLGARPLPGGDDDTAPLLHVVLFELKKDAPPGEAEALITECRRLLAAIPGVDEVRVGRKAKDDRDVHVKDYDVALSVRLRRARDLAVYSVHPRHVELVTKLRPHLARMRVIDFYAE